LTGCDRNCFGPGSAGIQPFFDDGDIGGRQSATDGGHSQDFAAPRHRLIQQTFRSLAGHDGGTARTAFEQVFTRGEHEAGHRARFTVAGQTSLLQNGYGGASVSADRGTAEEQDTG
jgi:hypothetical protein